MPKGFFITGTDTGVGKTVISAALIKAAGFIGLRACGMKPIETGCKISGLSGGPSEAESLTPSDGMFLRKMSGMEDPIDLITPICFKTPLAPLSASKIEKKSVDLGKIKEAFELLARKYDVIIAEGVGGLLVPIKRDYFVLDLAGDLGLPLIVVSRPGLGTINHTLLTVNYALKEGLNVAGIVINHSNRSEGNLAEDTNPEVIREVSAVPIIGVFPHLQDLGSATIEKAVVENLDLEIIKKYL